MAMDVLRSGHTTTARVGSDNQTSTTLKWYRCQPGAKAFPGFHAFGNPVWEPHVDDWTAGPGVDWPPVKWSATAAAFPPPGLEFHGLREWYEKGIPQSVLDAPADYERESCFGDPIALGLRCGAIATASVLIGEMCPECPTLAYLPPSITVRTAHFSGDTDDIYMKDLPESSVVVLDKADDTIAGGINLGAWSFQVSYICNYLGVPGPTVYISIGCIFSPGTSVGASAAAGWNYDPVGMFAGSSGLYKQFGCGAGDVSEDSNAGTLAFTRDGFYVSFDVRIET